MPAKAQRYADVIEFLDGVVIVLASRFEVGDKPRETEAADEAKAGSGNSLTNWVPTWI